MAPADEIPPQVVAVWRRLCEIYDNEAEDRWEEDVPPGRRREYLDAKNALMDLLGLGPHQENPFDAHRATPPADYSDWQRAHWCEAWAVRRKIERAVAAAGKRQRKPKAATAAAGGAGEAGGTRGTPPSGKTAPGAS